MQKGFLGKDVSELIGDWPMDLFLRLHPLLLPAFVEDEVDIEVGYEHLDEVVDKQ